MLTLVPIDYYRLGDGKVQDTIFVTSDISQTTFALEKFDPTKKTGSGLM
ncbi:MAG: hypothetical protein CM15mP44_7620 [Candidatus Neomarinimicrobiota bacterium]|nr:MAG: hypothetical protein CM15mP44_7620 [Candidatus Neomarinimicrobiota bacterium]